MQRSTLTIAAAVTRGAPSLITEMAQASDGVETAWLGAMLYAPDAGVDFRDIGGE